MGGKGKRRREKNYRAAHGGNSRLPPPPDPSSLDAVPSKLRKIMSLTEGCKPSTPGTEKNRGDSDTVTDKRLQLKNRLGSKNPGTTRGAKDGKSVAKDPDLSDEVVQNRLHDKKKKKKKRKRNNVNDLRFEAPENVAVTGSKRKERKKQRLEERKKKQKRIKEQETVGNLERDEVKFGDVVEAPPKLLTVPKPLKTSQDASQERLRIQAVEAYRKRKGWTSRPGVQLPPAVTTFPLS